MDDKTLEEGGNERPGVPPPAPRERVEEYGVFVHFCLEFQIDLADGQASGGPPREMKEMADPLREHAEEPKILRAHGSAEPFVSPRLENGVSEYERHLQRVVALAHEQLLVPTDQCRIGEADGSCLGCRQDEFINVDAAFDPVNGLDSGLDVVVHAIA